MRDELITTILSSILPKHTSSLLCTSCISVGIIALLHILCLHLGCWITLKSTMYTSLQYSSAAPAALAAAAAAAACCGVVGMPPGPMMAPAAAAAAAAAAALAEAAAILLMALSLLLMALMPPFSFPQKHLT
uniref:Uncharacterized protein n=1 Tax=Glossina palpalis gambiensis TaxID=67801 RepID=A0A1B0BJQ6_9MUSC